MFILNANLLKHFDPSFHNSLLSLPSHHPICFPSTRARVNKVEFTKILTIIVISKRLVRRKERLYWNTLWTACLKFAFLFKLFIWGWWPQCFVTHEHWTWFSGPHLHELSAFSWIIETGFGVTGDMFSWMNMKQQPELPHWPHFSTFYWGRTLGQGTKNLYPRGISHTNYSLNPV